MIQYIHQKDVAETITVKIEDVKFDDSHEKNVCYEIKSYPSEASGGTVLEEQITSVVITSDPVLRDDNGKQIEYTYGDKLNLNRGAVTVEYDSGRIQKNLKFNELTKKQMVKLNLYILTVLMKLLRQIMMS